jgi:hypothetical protein
MRSHATDAWSRFVDTHSILIFLSGFFAAAVVLAIADCLDATAEDQR